MCALVVIVTWDSRDLAVIATPIFSKVESKARQNHICMQQSRELRMEKKERDTDITLLSESAIGSPAAFSTAIKPPPVPVSRSQPSSSDHR